MIRNPLIFWGWVIVIALTVALLGLGKCALDSRHAAKAARDGRTMAEGRTASAVDAITEIGRLNQRGDASDKEVQDAQDAIRQADPGARDAVARAQLCRLQHRADCDRL